ncbi:amidohydrolase [Streptomyces sp. NPDC087440]|uniref:amidohydrolase n=1 Tax=Streptomyces sp. NPDC087440 TaxID=3365790 RepID=UPI0037FCACB0
MNTAARTLLQAALQDRAADVHPELVALSHALHDDPEVAFEEHRSAARVTDVLARHGFDVTTGVSGLDTAFTATFGTGSLTVGVCVEYDALPDIGHACGHNVIAATSVGAALALARFADQLDITVKAIGTPAEEHGGGKVILLEKGVFDDVAIAMMAHPMPTADIGAHHFPTQAVARFRVHYTGTPAHAAAAPHLGVNAASAAVVAQVAIGQLRQQIPGDHRIAAYVSHGGAAINIIPESTTVECEVRAFTMEEMQALKMKAEWCFAAGAQATGCAMEMEATQPDYADMRADTWFSERYLAHLTALGRTPVTLEPGKAGGSTDFGNISHVMPAIHPALGILGATHMPHTHGFTAETNTPAADDAILVGAKALASAAADLALDAEQRGRALSRLAARS